MFGIQKLGRPRRQDQPHAGALPDLRGDHCAHAFADLQRVAPQPAGRGHHLPVRRHFAVGVCDSGGALRIVGLPFGEGRKPASQGRGEPGDREGRALKPDAEGQGTGWRSLQEFVAVAVRHQLQDFHGAVALFDGDAELDALHQAPEALRVVALFGADHALGYHASLVRQGEHDAAVQPLDAQVDAVLGAERVGDDLKRIVHGALPPDKNMQSLTAGVGISSHCLTTGQIPFSSKVLQQRACRTAIYPA